MKKKFAITFITVACLAFVLSGTTFAAEFTVEKTDVKGDEPDYSPYVDRNIPTRVF